MKYDKYAKMIRLFLKGPIYKHLKKEMPELVTKEYKKRVDTEYRAFVERTEGIGGVKYNSMELIILFLGYAIAVYKAADGRMSEELFSSTIDAFMASNIAKFSSKMEKPFSKKTIEQYKKFERLSQEKKYENDWLSTFKYEEGSGEYFITYKECAICKICKKEGVFHLVKYMCKTDYPSFEYKGVILDRTKTLGFEDEECNFHVMTKERAKELHYVRGEDAK